MNDQFVPAGLTPDIQPKGVAPVVQNAQPTPQVPPPLPPIPQKVPGLLSKMLPILLGVGGVFFGAFVFYVVQKNTQKEVTPGITTVFVTPTSIPTPVRYPTNVSTTSGFLSLEQSISSFSSELIEFSKDDPALTPPNLNLTLGF